MRLGRLFLFVVTKIHKEQSNDANNHQGILEQVGICYHPGVPPLIKSQGATKRLAPPGVSKYIRGLTTYRFSVVPTLFYQIRHGSARTFSSKQKRPVLRLAFLFSGENSSISGAPGCHQYFTQKVSPPRKRGVGRACLGGYAMAV